MIASTGDTMAIDTPSAAPRAAPGAAPGANALMPRRSLVDNAVFGVGVLTQPGRWRAANPALVRMLGCDSEEAVLALEPDAYFVNPEDIDRIRRAREGKRLARGVTCRWRTADGRDVIVRMSGQEIDLPCTGACGPEAKVGSEETPRGPCLHPVELLIEDITERRKLEDQLRQAQKMESIGAMSGGIAHDFNNILTIVLSNADLIAESLPPESFHIRADLDELQRAARRGADLIGKLLSFSRRQDLRPEVVELGEVVRDASSMIRRLLPAPISFDMEMDRRERHFVHADTTAIQQILMNLVTNARDAMPNGGTLTVRLERLGSRTDGEAGRIRLSVRDTGCGMDAARVERVFEPFFTTKESGRGTGLGLPMVQALSAQLGGTVAIDSIPGRGTTVRIEIPAVEAPVEGAVAVPISATTPAGTGCVLVAEDDEVIRRSIRRVLEREGYTVVTCADGQEAFEWLDLHPGGADLVLSDLVMPRMGGVDLYRAVRSKGDTTRFLFTSGYLDPDTRAEVDADPDLVFVPKPWTIAELVASVRPLTEPARPKE